jgi:Family of unknown function (DUF6516)
MKARLLLKERIVLSQAAFAEIVVWQVPEPVRGSRHAYKYRMALVVDETCVMRYDNEAGKGDHRHIETTETRLNFNSLDELYAAFWTDVDNWLDVNGRLS